MSGNLQSEFKRLIFTNKFLCLFTVLLLLVADVKSQNAILSGKVTDSISTVGVPGVTVLIKELQFAVSSDEAGNYSMVLIPGTYTLEFRSIGYETSSTKLTFAADQKYTVNAKLKATARELGTTVISASKFEQNIQDVTVSMAVLTPTYIENANQTNVETAVEQVSGVTVIDGQANIRGGSGFSYGAGSRVLVLVDDLPMLAGDANDVKWSFLPIENVGQIEVIKGASSVLFGSSALNGVINMRTAIPGDKPETIVTVYSGWYGTPQRAYTKWWNNNDQLTSGFSFSHRQKMGQFDLVLGGNYLTDDGYRQGETELRYRANVNLRYRFKKIQGLSVGIALNSQKAEGGNFLIWQDDSLGTLLPQGGIGLPGSTLSLYVTKRTTVDPYITYIGKKSVHKIRTRYYLTNNKNDTEQESLAKYYYGEYLFQYFFNKYITTSIGIVGSKSVVSGDLYGDQTSNNTAEFAQIDGNYKKLIVSAGIRNEHGHISGDDLGSLQLFRVGGNYQLFEYTHLRASYGQGFRFPSIAEKYVKTRVGSIVIYPNDSINTETGWSAEFGISQGFKIGKFLGLVDVSVFETEYRDMMEFTFGPWGTAGVDPFFGLGFKSLNIGNANIKGFELAVSGEGKIGNVLQTLMAGYTWIDPIQSDFNPARDTLTNSSNENILKYRYCQMFKFDAQWTYKKVGFGFSARYYSFMENIDEAFEIAIPGVKDYREKNNSGDWICDTRVAYIINKTLNLSFIVKNVFNNEFMTRPADIQPPRSFVFQLLIDII